MDFLFAPCGHLGLPIMKLSDAVTTALDIKDQKVKKNKKFEFPALLPPASSPFLPLADKRTEESKPLQPQHIVHASQFLEPIVADDARCDLERLFEEEECNGTILFRVTDSNPSRKRRPMSYADNLLGGATWIEWDGHTGLVHSH